MTFHDEICVWVHFGWIPGIAQGAKMGSMRVELYAKIIKILLNQKIHMSSPVANSACSIQRCMCITFHELYTELKPKVILLPYGAGQIFPYSSHLHNWNSANASSATLTHRVRDKIAAIYQTTFSNTFLEQKCTNCNWYFTEVCSQGSNTQYSSIG